jgi:dienelactone hydrolase
MRANEENVGTVQEAAVGVSSGASGYSAQPRPVIVLADGCPLQGDLAIPAGAKSIVLFAHGSGSSRHSPRNRFVAEVLQRAGHGTLLMDLLTAEEERVDELTRQLRFDIEMLAGRLTAAVDWIAQHESMAGMRIGLFGASTGAAAALISAAGRPQLVRSVVSRGGRPDLAGASLPAVQAPTLLIVGGEDDVVIELNRQAYGRLRCEKRLEIVPGATHLFEEPGALAQVAQLAADWFTRTLKLSAARV